MVRFCAFAFAMMIGVNVWADDLADFSETATSAAEDARILAGGIGPDSDVTAFVPVWVRIDGTGLSAAALTRMRNAFNCDLDGSPTRLARLLCHLSELTWAGGRPTKAGLTNEWVGYVLMPRRAFRRMKWCAGDAGCGQSGRVAIIGPDWETIATHPRCTDFFDAGRCVSGSQPLAVFSGVDPNHDGISPTPDIP